MVLIVLVASLSSIMVAAESDRVVVEDFDPIYYTNEKDTAMVSTKITIIGDDLKGSDVPVHINFYEENGRDLIATYDLQKELIDYQTGLNGGKPVYKYKNYTGDFGFEESDLGERIFGVVIVFNNAQEYVKLYTVNIDPGIDPAIEDHTQMISSIGIIIVIITILIFLVAGIPFRYSRKDLVSETHVGLDIEAEDTEIIVCLEDDSFKKVPVAKRGPVSLKSQTSQSEIDIE